MPTPFKIIKSVSEVDEETWITSFPKVVTCGCRSPMSAFAVPVLTHKNRESTTYVIVGEIDTPECEEDADCK